MLVRNVAALLSTVLVLPVLAQLPEIQLDALTPAGAQQGKSVTIQLHGSHLTELSAVHCEHDGIQGTIENGQAVLIIADNVPAGVYDVRVQGRFGLSNPRAFVVGDLPEVLESSDHHQPDKAMALPENSVVHGQADAQKVDWYRVEPTSDGLMHVTVMAERIDSRMDPTVVICDPRGHELQRENDGHGRDVAFTVPWLCQADDGR